MIMLKVRPHGNGAFTDIPVNPYKMDWGNNDISADDAGRTEDAKMHKNKIAEKRKVGLAWRNLSLLNTAKILWLFKSEYIDVQYYDALPPDVNPFAEGMTEEAFLQAAWITKTFYVGDRAASVQMWTDEKQLYGDINFSIIEQ